jgi:hypothetical protein
MRHHVIPRKNEGYSWIKFMGRYEIGSRRWLSLKKAIPVGVMERETGLSCSNTRSITKQHHYYACCQLKTTNLSLRYMSLFYKA